MLIMPMDKSKYPKNWDAISRYVRETANWKCEFCGARNGAANPATGSKVVLTIFRLDHDTTNNGIENLRALCQKCHLNSRKASKREELILKGQLEFVKW